MAQRAASYGVAVLHKKRLTMKHCFAKAPQYEASPFHSDMKQFAYAPYDLQSSPLWLDFLYLDFTHSENASKQR